MVATETSIFALDDHLQALMEQAQEEEQGGHIRPETEVAIREYFEAAREKVDRIGGYLLAMESRKRVLKDEAARLSERAATTENNIRRTKSMVQRFLTDRGLARIAGVRCTLSLSNNSQAALAVADPEAVPDRFYRSVLQVPCEQAEDICRQFDVLRESRELDTAALRAALEAGEEIPGATLERGRHVRVR